MKRLAAAMLRTLGWLVLLLLLAFAGVHALRWNALDDADRAARALMDVPPPERTGSNGFAALMLAGHEVPPAQLDAAMAADVAAFMRWHEEHFGDALATDGVGPAAGAAAGTRPPVYVALADTTFPPRPPLPDSTELCGLSAPGCLALVRGGADRFRALLDGHAARLASVERALAADHIASPYPPSMAAPLADVGSLRLLLTAVAMDAVEGRADQAYIRTCELLADARRMDREGGSLVEKLVPQALAEGTAWLLLDLRRELPVAALPASCAQALAPVDIAEASVCPALRGEFRLQHATATQLATQLRGWKPTALLTRLLLVDVELQSTWVARALAPFCTPEAAALAAGGLSPPPAPAAVGFEEPGCYGAYVSCVLAQIAGPSYDGFALRSLDHAARLRLLLATQAVADGRSDAADAAAAASVAGYPVDYDPVTQVARVRLRRPGDVDRADFDVDFSGLAPAAPTRSFAARPTPSLSAG